MYKTVMYCRRISDGSNALADELGIKRLKIENSRFIPSQKKTIINWGSSDMPEHYLEARVINRPDAVGIASHKLKFFNSMAGDDGPRCVPYTTDKDTVLNWLREGYTAVARQKLQGYGGEGMALFGALDAFVEAPLWTRYVKKKDEFRVHVVNREIISVQRKAAKLEFDGDRDHRIRNLANGYVFARNDVVVPDDVLTQAGLVFDKLALDFGAVDVLYNLKQDKAYVLEVNTAPGLEGTTVQEYALAIEKHYGNR